MLLAQPIHEISIQFSDDSLTLLNICLGFIMFGIALGINPADFKMISLKPKGVFTGVISQFLLLPFFTFLIVLLLNPHPAFALGMILVAACPGGNISNFISSISGANTALSVSLTGIATLLTPLLTPLNFNLWANAIPETQEYLASFSISFTDILKTVFLLLVLPLATGQFVRYQFRKIASRIEKPIRVLSFILLMGFIGVALVKNWEAFKDYLYLVFFLVLVHNTIAFLVGFLSGKIARVGAEDRRAIAIETGIQNSGLGLIIIFTFFGGNGAMALVAAWWGIWHIISGMLLAAVLKWSDKQRLEIKQV